MTGRSVVHVVLTDAFAGTERVVAMEAAGLAIRGWDVTVIGGCPRRMSEAVGPAVRVVPAASVVAGARALLARSASLVHAHLTSAETAAVVTRPVVRAPVVATRHIAARRGHSVAGGLAAPWIRRGLTGQVAISQYVASQVDGRCTVIANGVPTRDAAPTVRDRTVLIAQRLEPEKATGVALRSWAASGLATQGWQLDVAGDGAERGHLERLAAELGVTGSVTFLGWTDDVTVRLRRAALVLAPATAEPFGLTVVEAMAAGTPVVAADGGAHREVLGERARVFPVGDHQAAGRLLGELAADETGRADYGAALLARQRKEFSVEAHLDRLETLYDEVLAGGDRR